MRVEIGPRDLEKNEITIVRRDTGEKKNIIKKMSTRIIKNELDSISKKLFEKAKSLIKNNTHRVETIEEAKTKKGIVELPWCGNDNCALEIENILEGNTIGEPIENNKENIKYSCPICNKPAKTIMRFSRSY